MIDANKPPPAFDARRYKLHARSVTDEHGRQRTEKRPIVKSAYMVDPSGHVCYLPLYGGPSQNDPDDQYMTATLRSKTKAGWVDHDSCPKTSGHNVTKFLPESAQQGPACVAGAKPGPRGEAAPIGRQNPCKCIVALIAQRRGLNATKMLAVEGQARTEAQVSHQLATANLEETRKLNQKLAEALLKDKPAEKSAEKSADKPAERSKQ